MNVSTTHVPVLISGAGLTGLYLALSLVKNGVSVRIIEKEHHHHSASRGAGTQPRTREMHRLLGIEDRIHNWGGGTETPPMVVYKSDGVTIASSTPLIAPEECTPARPYGSPICVPQFVHERILREALARYGVAVEQGRELVSFVQDNNGVTATIRVRGETGEDDRQETILAEFLCGADGAKGPIRKLINCSFLGNTEHGNASIVADTVIRNLEDTFHMWKLPPGQTSVILRPSMDGDHTFNVLIMGFSGSLDAEGIVASGKLVQFLKNKVRRDLDAEEPHTISLYRPHIRMVDKFQDRRVFLLGDAAHIHPPTGAQGLNSGILDSLNLGWKLALVLKQFSPLSLLTSYNEERLPVIAQMLQKTTGLYHSVRDYDEKEKSSTDGAHSDNQGTTEVAFFGTTGLFQLGVNYRWSSIVTDMRASQNNGLAKDDWKAFAYGGHDDDVRAGDRAPDAPGLLEPRNDVSPTPATPIRLFDVFSPSKHTIMVFVRSTADLDPSLGEVFQSIAKATIQIFVISRHPLEPPFPFPVDRVFLDTDGHAHSGYRIADAEPVTIVVVRPDMYIGAIVPSAAGLTGYFHLIFKDLP